MVGHDGQRHLVRALGTEVDQAAARVEALSAEHGERARWYSDTTEVRERAAEARAALARRNGGRDLPEDRIAREDMDEAAAYRHDAHLAREEQAQRLHQQRESQGLRMNGLGLSGP